MKRNIIASVAIAMLLTACGQSQQNNSAGNQTTPEENGKQLFVTNCSQCHSINQDKMGPKLAGVISHWNNDTTQVKSFIKNSQQIVSSKQNAYATKLFSDWNQAAMPSFPNLSDKDINDILAYINKGQD